MSIKKPKLNFQEVYVVKDWSHKIEKGVGVFFPILKEGLCDYQNYWLVWIDNDANPKKIYKSEVFIDYNEALKRLRETKTDYINYLKKEIENKNQLLKELQS